MHRNLKSKNETLADKFHLKVRLDNVHGGQGILDRLRGQLLKLKDSCHCTDIWPRFSACLDTELSKAAPMLAEIWLEICMGSLLDW